MTDSTDSPTKRAILELRKQEGNDSCADCGRKGEEIKGGPVQCGPDSYGMR